MKHKNYMVVRLLKNDEGFSKSPFEAPNLYDNYDDAFDAFNSIIAEEGGQLFKQPKGDEPLRASLKYEDVEIWIITRTDELVKTK